ncbi:polysaccharide biosynthesis/export family protein [Desulfolutivibrio sulfodismutans]|uniref:polysaccharide biosynthesis/export family protein n=1 Tax=Desulfolutivibrio sulfodismutans TaxID=63561 RepID=UPI001BADC579|nr:polysaccharide biosynthesis/export family protein [Desulfolutivibrio sulfodismutans]
MPTKYAAWAVVLIFSLLASGCGLPGSGPTRATIDKYPESDKNTTGISIVEVNASIARQLRDSLQKTMFSAVFSGNTLGNYSVGPGDILEVTVWESPPGTLFNNPGSELATAQTAMAPMRFPEQQVNSDGSISVPFAGYVPVRGLTLRQIEEEIYRRLQGKANDPQVLVRLAKNTTSTVTVVGEVTNSIIVPLTPKRERILDILATAGGVKQPVNKVMIQLTRAEKVHSIPLKAIISDNKENLVLEPGDILTALYQPNSFIALGATGKNAEVEFEATGLTLAQALARSGGVQDGRADAQGVFIFRLEPMDSLKWPTPPTIVTPENTVPVIYSVNLRDPATFFAAQSFPIKDKDVLYVSNAPATEIMKFLSIITSVTSPSLNTLGYIRSFTATGAWN